MTEPCRTAPRGTPEIPCACEPDVVRALLEGRTPDAFDPDLRGHLAGCAACREVIAVASALLDEAAAARAQASVPTASVVWWRAQRRARREAAARAARPVTVTQAVAAASVAGLVAALAWPARAWLAGWASWVLAGVPHVPTEVLGALRAAPLPQLGAMALLGAAALLVVVPVALYVLVLRE